MGNLIDLTGQRFGHLTVLSRFKDGSHNTKWLCKCDCGNERVVQSTPLRNGVTTSCGCLSRPNHFVHGYSHKERLYGIWRGIRQRCRDTKISRAKSYVEKGVSLCDEWQNYSSFREWAMVSGYADGLSIDRIDNNGNYCPENCRWATSKEQANNRSTNRHVTYNGQTRTLSEWGDLLGMSSKLLSGRLRKGWSVEDALTRSVRRSAREH